MRLVKAIAWGDERRASESAGGTYGLGFALNQVVSTFSRSKDGLAAGPTNGSRKAKCKDRGLYAYAIACFLGVMPESPRERVTKRVHPSAAVFQERFPTSKYKKAFC